MKHTGFFTRKTNENESSEPDAVDTLAIAPDGLSQAGESFHRQRARPGSPNRKQPSKHAAAEPLASACTGRL